MIYCMYIYHRQQCIYFINWNRSRLPRGGSEARSPSDDVPGGADGSRAEQKLLSGLLFSMKSFCRKIAPGNAPPTACNSFDSFSTRCYKVHYYEAASGLQVVVMTSPSVADLHDDITRIIADMFVPHVTRSPLYIPGKPIQSETFAAELDRYVRGLSSFSTPAAII